MSAVNALREEGHADTIVFHLDTGLNFLALSLPFSTILILGICSVGPSLAVPQLIWLMALSFFLLLAGVLFFGKIKSPQPQPSLN